MLVANLKSRVVLLNFTNKGNISHFFRRYCFLLFSLQIYTTENNHALKQSKFGDFKSTYVTVTTSGDETSLV